MASNDLINIGTIANDGTGDNLRVAFRKINQKFNDVDFRIGDTFDVINAGNGEGLFVERINDNDDDPSNNDVLFKSIISGDNIEVTATNNNEISISAPNMLTTTDFITDSGSYTLTTGNDVKLTGGDGITTSIVNGEIVITNNFVSELSEDTTPTLGGQLDADGNNIVNVNRISASDFIGGTFRGKLLGTIEDAKTKDVSGFFTDLDFGGFNRNVTSFYSYLIEAFDVSLGTVSNPADVSIDLGGIVQA